MSISKFYNMLCGDGHSIPFKVVVFSNGTHTHPTKQLGNVGPLLIYINIYINSIQSPCPRISTHLLDRKQALYLNGYVIRPPHAVQASYSDGNWMHG